ncbi:hypothetical protein BS17DRAFT_813852 [Gyrodon lividus]|nr:hypothetical protein BS17DRAFT_813852 [Gyrodon lividus]
MPAIEKAIEALRIAVHKKGVDRHARDAFSHLTSCLVLLNSSAPSLQATMKLHSVLRQPLLPLYEACLQPTLQLSSALLAKILEKLCDAHSHGDAGSHAGWDATADVILSGVLDLLEQKPDSKCKAAVGEILYPVICNFFFPEASQDPLTLSVPLCLSAYNTLTEAALWQSVNQDALRDKAVLGGERLAVAISRSRDYLLIEGLLTLFARLLPPTHNTAQGKFRRTKFVKEVLGSPKLFKCSAELLDIMHKISSTDWDDTAAHIIDALARSDITYPQPFSIAEIDVCGRVFPQPMETDRLIMDRQGFLANVILENDDPCESLQVPYAYIHTVTIDNSMKVAPKGKALIKVVLTSPSLVGNVEMKLPAGSYLYAKFLLESDTLGRFMEALRRRGVGKLSFVNASAKTAKPQKSISLASGFRFTDGTSPLPPAASFEDKVKHVKEVYQTDAEDPTTSGCIPVPDLGDVVLLSSPSPKPTTKVKKLPSATHPPLVNKNESVTANNNGSAVSLTIKTKSPFQRGPVAHSSRDSSAKAMRALVFGESDEELSEVSDIEPEKGTLKQPQLVSAPRPGREKKAKLATTGAKAPKRTIKRKWAIDSDDEAPGTSAAKGSEESAENISKVEDDAEGIVGKPLKTEKPPLSGNPSRPNPLVDLSVEADLLATVLPTYIKVASRQPPVPNGRSVTDPNVPTTRSVIDEGLHDPRPIFDSPTTGPKRVNSKEVQIEQHSSRQAPAMRGKRDKVYSPAKASEETGPPPRIAGSRRKRQNMKPSSELAAVDAEDELAPPQKRSRKANDEERGTTTDKNTFGQRLSSLGPATTTALRPTKRYGRKPKASSPCTSPTMVNFDEVPGEHKSSRSSTRRTARVKEKLIGPARETRTTAMRGNSWKQANAKLTTTVKLEKSDAALPKETGAEISPSTTAIQNSVNLTTVVTRKDPNSPDPGSNVRDTATVETSKAENIISGAKLNTVQGAPKASAVPPRKSSCANSKPKTVLWEDPNSVQCVSPDPIRSESEEKVHVEKAPDAQFLVADLSAMPGDVSDIIDYSISLKGSEDPVDLASDPPAKKPTPRKEVITIDLTRDDSPVQNKPEVHKASAPLVEVAPAISKTGVRATEGTSDKFICTNTEDVSGELTISPPRRKRLSVTFASPAEHPVHDDAKHQLNATRSKELRLVGTRSVRTQTRIDYLDSRTDSASSSRLLSASEDDTLSPLTIPRMSANTNVKTHVSVAHVPIAEEVEIQDIVDVLNDIQAVIIKGISDRFKNVKNDVRAGRNRLVQQALDDLQDMAVENARHFNELVSLEEEYHKYRKTSTRRWEELIDCNESISEYFQNALKEHDQNISAKTFPKSILPQKPLFSCHLQNV